ncbi:MAG: histidine phosphatase family protein [Gaiellaceae bacterium]
MLVFLVRHAHAEPGEPDEKRSLSARGHEEARALAERLARHDTPPETVLTSPFLRARETAGAIAEATGAVLLVEDLLAPGTTADGLRAAVAQLDGPVAAVGHQPDCSEIALELIGSDPGFPPAGVAEIALSA